MVTLEGSESGFDLGQTDELVSLDSGEPMDVRAATQFLLSRPARIIAIVGDRESGKTTLTAAVYERFLRGTFAGLRFANSRTLVGFEQRLHLARVESGRSIPDTPRTSLGEDLHFYHIAVTPIADPLARDDLLISDRAGEMYRQLRDSPVTVGEFVELTRANRILLLLDGARVVNNAERPGAIQGVRQMVRVICGHGEFDRRPTVQVVMTKADLLAGHINEGRIRSELATFYESLVNSFGSNLAGLSFRDVAARPLSRNSELPPAYGVAELVTDWLTPEPRREQQRWRSPNFLSSEFDRFWARTPLEYWP